MSNNNINKCTLSDINYYSMDGKHSTFALIRFELDCEINKEIMKSSLAKTSKRFPYFQCTLKKDKVHIYTEITDKEPRLYEDDLDYVIDYRQNEELLYRVSVNNNILSIYFFHGLSDGVGIMNFAKVMLCEYYKSLGEEVTPPKDIFDINGEADLEETIEPLDMLPEDTKPGVGEKTEFYEIPKKNTDKFLFYTFSVKEKKILEMIERYSTSPNAIAEIEFAKAVATANKKAVEKGIDIAVSINMKPYLNTGKSHLPCLQVSSFHFDEKMFSKDEEMLHTLVRGKLFRDCVPEHLFMQLARIKTLGEIFEYLQDVKARQLLALKSTNVSKATATVSYVGVVDFGSIEKHIKSIHSYCDACAPVIEMNYINNAFHFTISSKSEIKDIVDCFYKQMTEKFIECTPLETEVFTPAKGKGNLPRFGFNMATYHLVSGIKKYKKHLTN